MRVGGEWERRRYREDAELFCLERIVSLAPCPRARSMMDKMVVSEASPSRTSALPNALPMRPGVVRLLNSDTTWAENLVVRIYQRDPESTACWIQEHKLDNHLDVLAPDFDVAKQAAQELVQELRTLRVSSDGVIGIRKSSRSFATLVRRMLMTRVSVLALTEVTIDENTGDTIDEVVAHRLGQIALKGSGDEAVASIEVEGRPVLASDLNFLEGVSVAPEDQDVVLIHLRRGQRFMASARARRGMALEHAKFSAVAAVPILEEHVLASPPSREVRRSLVEAGFVVGASLELTRPDGQLVRVERAKEVARSHEPLAFRTPKNFQLPVEPLGQLDAASCLEKGVEQVAQEVEDFCKALQKSFEP